MPTPSVGLFYKIMDYSKVIAMSKLTAETIRNAPGLEWALYDRAAWDLARAEGFDTRDLSGLYRRIAMDTKCTETTFYGRHFMAALGGSAVMREYHVLDDNWAHWFYSVPSQRNKISEEDIVVDPTYLQFADRVESISDEMPNVFIGARKAVIDLMLDESFSTMSHAAGLYRETSLIYHFAVTEH